MLTNRKEKKGSAEMKQMDHSHGMDNNRICYDVKCLSQKFNFITIKFYLIFQIRFNILQ